MNIKLRNHRIGFPYFVPDERGTGGRLDCCPNMQNHLANASICRKKWHVRSRLRLTLRVHITGVFHDSDDARLIQLLSDGIVAVKTSARECFIDHHYGWSVRREILGPEV